METHLRTEQPKIVVLRQDPILLVLSGLAGLGFGFNHLTNGSITDEARAGHRENLERFGAGTCANHADQRFCRLLEMLVLKSVPPHSGVSDIRGIPEAFGLHHTLDHFGGGGLGCYATDRCR
jgi:hypothetical protein